MAVRYVDLARGESAEVAPGVAVSLARVSAGGIATLGVAAPRSVPVRRAEVPPLPPREARRRERVRPRPCRRPGHTAEVGVGGEVEIDGVTVRLLGFADDGTPRLAVIGADVALRSEILDAQPRLRRKAARETARRAEMLERTRIDNRPGKGA